MSKQNHSSQLKIDRLVLRGFSHADAIRVRDAFTSTLECGVVDSDQLNVSPRQYIQEHRCLPTVQANNPQTIGRLAAEALLHSLKPGAKKT